MDPEPNPTICIGHGMGAHICGMAGMTAKSRKKRIREKNTYYNSNNQVYNRKQSESSMGHSDELVSPLKLSYRYCT